MAELGGGANPTVELLDRLPQPVELTVIDISPEELAKAPDEVTRRCVDLCSAHPPLRDQFDMVFSRMLCEHVASGSAFHRNCSAMLKPGGHAVHFFPTATALPFVANRILPERLAQFAFETAFRRVVKGVVTARSRPCTTGAGPHTAADRPLPVRRLRGRDGLRGGAGPQLLRQTAGPPEHRAGQDAQLLAHPTPWLAAYALVVLQRSGDSAEGST